MVKPQLPVPCSIGTGGTVATVILGKMGVRAKCRCFYIVFSVQPLFMARLAKLDESYEHWLAVI